MSLWQVEHKFLKVRIVVGGGGGGGVGAEFDKSSCRSCSVPNFTDLNLRVSQR